MRDKATDGVHDDLFAPTAIIIARLLDQMFVSRSEKSFAQSKAAYGQLATQLEKQGRVFQLEVKRRIAERILDTAQAKGITPNQCRRYLDAVVKLGFTDLVQECMVRIHYCRYLIRHDKIGEATQMLKRLRAKCRRASETKRRELNELLGTIDALLDQAT
jgi:hypothetical protein